jgi:large subunit ribosomal protein L32e
MAKSKRGQKLKRALARKHQLKTHEPRFVRAESWRLKRLETGWRRPRGLDNKIREHVKGHPVGPSIGRRSVAELRALHPTGLQEVLVNTLSELEGLKPKVHAVRIGHRVGERKRLALVERADDLGLHVLNPQLKSRPRETLEVPPEEK